MALAEMRAMRRLLRFRIAAVVLTLLAVAPYAISCVIQSYIAPYSPSFVGTTPLYLLGSIDPTYFLIFQIASLVLLFDVDQRHARARIAEVLESRALSNFEYLAGRVVGCAGLLWAVVAVNLLAMQTFGLIAQWSRLDLGGSLQVHSIFNLLFVDAPIALLFWCSYVIFLGSVFRNRLATLAIGLLGMCVWCLLVLTAPFAFLDLVSPSSNDTLFVSDILPEFPTTTSLMVRMVMLGLAALLTVAAACALRRTDKPLRAPTMIAAASLAVIVLSTLSVAGFNVLQQRNESASWREAHQTYLLQGVVDVQSIRGNVQIEPGRRLRIDLHLYFTVDAEQFANELIFTFNPGMKIAAIELNAEIHDFSFENGILKVKPQQSLETNVAHQLRIVAHGVPNSRFGYLDAPFDYTLDSAWSLEATRSFGTDVSLFESRYVALMPGSYWYPIPGLMNERYGEGKSTRDFFELDLNVELTNSSWQLAGTCVHPKTDSSLNQYKVKCNVPLSEFAFFASDFTKASAEIEGVNFSVFLHSRHDKNIHLPERVREDLEQEVVETLQEFGQHGLHPLQQSLSIVEVPNRLRTVGGGWRMDSLNALSGTMLLKERGYPVARIDLMLKRELDPKLKFFRFAQFFRNGLGTDNIFYTIHKHYWSHATAASGHQSELLDHFTHSLLKQYMPRRGESSWFSVYAAIPFLRMAVVHPLYAIDPSSAEHSIYSSRLQDQEYAYARRDSALERIERTSLADLPTEHGHQADLTVALLKIEQIAIALSFYEQDADKVLAWLASVRRKFAGKTYQYDDLIAIAREHEIEVHPFLTDWITASAVPGFVTSRASITRLSDDEDGTTRFETKFAIQNTQPVEGFVNVEHMNEAVPIHIEGDSTKQISLVSVSPPPLDSTRRFELYSGLSMNRGNIQIPSDVTDIPWREDAEPGVLSSKSDWKPKQEGIVIDDLDKGFSVDQPQTFLQNSRWIGPARWFLWPLPDIEHDRQLPILGRGYVLPRGWWRRTNEQNAYGVYRGTLAMTQVGRNSKTKLARFTAEVPHAGQWALDFHVHSASSWFGYQQLAHFQLIVSNGQESWTAEVDPVTSVPEWRFVDKYDLQVGTVNVDVVGAANRSIVYADAIRWTRSDENEPIQADAQ